MTDAPFRILTVCVGNVCRSPLAERLLVKQLAESPVRVEASSAGVGALIGEPMERHAAAQLASLGGDPSGFLARQLEPAMVDEADLVLTATERIRQRVLHESPLALRRTFTLREFGMLLAGEGQAGDTLEDIVADAARRRGSIAGENIDIPDPMGRGTHAHLLAARLASEAVSEIAAVFNRVRV